MAASTNWLELISIFDRLSQPVRRDLTQVNEESTAERSTAEAFLLDAAQCELRAMTVSFSNSAKPEVIMLEFYEPGAAIIENSVANAVARLTKANKSVLNFMFGAQKAMFEEIAFVSSEMFDRTRTEMHLFSETASKVAGAHSVKDMKAMCEECGQHQIDFIRRDSERLFRQGERMIEATSKLFGRTPQN
jgi:hypothetical protein